MTLISSILPTFLFGFGFILVEKQPCPLGKFCEGDLESGQQNSKL
jgi:hypothetical protein